MKDEKEISEGTASGTGEAAAMLPQCVPRSLVLGEGGWVEMRFLVDQEFLEDFGDRLLGLHRLIPLVGIAIRPCLVLQSPKERPLPSCAPMSVLRLTRPESALAVVEHR